MIVYYMCMRLKDENKIKSISEAAIKLIHEIGFAEASMSKIAKEAGVSPSTIYIYFENKEDMLNKIYLYAKKKFFTALSQDVDFEGSVIDILRKTYYNFYDFIINEPVIFSFSEQFANSPLIFLVNKEQVYIKNEPLIRIIKQGIDEGLLADVHPYIILTMGYAGLVTFIRNMNEMGEPVERKMIDDIFELIWKAIKK